MQEEILYTSHVRLISMYPFGMLMSERTFSGPVYRYGFNGQEKDDEVSGEGNTNTAEYWEYNTRLGRRWNLDPVYYTDINRYAVNGNNPIYFKDPLGDFKTKFGAKAYKFFHGGTVTKAESGPHKGEYYVTKKVEGEEGEKGHGKQADGKIDLNEVVVAQTVRWSWGDGSSSHPGNAVDNASKYISDNADRAWNSPFARYLVPDYVTYSGHFQTSSGIYMNEELTITVMLRGKDPGVYFNTTTSAGGVSAVGADVGCSLGRGYYLGNPREMSSSDLEGWQASVSGGVVVKPGIGGGVSVGADVGFDKGVPKTITLKLSVSAGVGVATPIEVSAGGGKSTKAIPLIKF